MKQPMSGSAIGIEDRAMTATTRTTRTTRTRRAAKTSEPTAKRTSARAAKPVSNPAPKPVSNPAPESLVSNPAPESLVDVIAQNAARALAAAQIDAAATGRDLTEVLADMGLNPDGTIKPQKQKYDGPMLILRDAAKHYIIAENGQPNCGDDLARICGQHKPEIVIKALIDALQIGFNPYAHLNIGQQSMNLRNKARHALKKDEIGMGQIRAAFIRAQA